jgi:hypothetical protein
MHRRGVTFLEVVFATALVAAISAAVTGLFSSIDTMQRREHRLLACAEVGNRLMLNYLDNPTKMPDPGKLVEYGPPENPQKFRWELKEQPIRLRDAKPEARDESRASPLKRDRMKQVTIRVWLSEQSGGGQRPDASTPMVVIARMVDPLALRNPDTVDHVFSGKDPELQQRYMEAMMGFSQGTGVPSGPPGSPAASAQSRGSATTTLGGRTSSRANPREAFGRARSSRDRSSEWAAEQFGGPGKTRR